MKYPKVYHQMQAMLRVCEIMVRKPEHAAYFEALAAELREQIEVMETTAALEALDDYTGELEDFEGITADEQESAEDALVA